MTPNHGFLIYAAFIFVFFSESCHLVKADTSVNLIRLKYKVFIIDNLPENTEKLVVHCAYKNDDLGSHDLNRGDNYNFEFYMNKGDITPVASCQFSWRFQKKMFQVRGLDVASKYRGLEMSNECFWEVNEDGFYVGKTPYILSKVYEW